MSNSTKFNGGFAKVVNNLPQAVLIVDDLFRIRYANEAAPCLLMTGKANTVNANLKHFIDSNYWLTISQAIRGVLHDEFKSKLCISTVQPTEGDKTSMQVTVVQFPADDGTLYALLRFDMPSKISQVQSVIDTKLQAAAVGSELINALDLIEDPVIVLDAKWRYQFVNKAGWDVLKKDPEEILGRNVWQLRPDLLKTEWKKAATRAMRTQTPQQIEEFYPQSKRWYITSFSPSPHAIVCRMEDITELKEARTINDQLFGTLEQAMESYWSTENTSRRRKNKLHHTK